VIYARALFLADGSSDEPLGAHVASLARFHDIDLDVVTPDLRRLDNPPGRTVHARLARMLEIDRDFDVLLVHRDVEAQDVGKRVAEIQRGVDKCSVDWPCVSIVPIRMTEAWLLLDEQAVRSVAGRPSGKAHLALPLPSQVETVPNPKAMLQQSLRTASGFSGRRLVKFKRDFPEHRRQLLERLDRNGPVQALQAWKALEASTAAMAKAVHAKHS